MGQQKDAEKSRDLFTVQMIDYHFTRLNTSHYLRRMKNNVGKPAEKFFQEFFTERGISDRD